MVRPPTRDPGTDQWEPRKIAVSDKNSSITLTVWAYFILGLRVAISPAQGQTILFGEKKNPRINSFWTNEIKEGSGEFFFPIESEYVEPTMCLLDENMNVMLTSGPNPDDKSLRELNAPIDERHTVVNQKV